ncbi:MAG: hypothetical protein FWH41_07875 [Treponema sp.]|nr:hypothetical protein [Treponema sp.]
MSGNINGLREQLFQTALSAGLPVISGDKCCRLLAWLYAYGGGREETVFNGRLRNDIFYAQRRVLNIWLDDEGEDIGSHIPDPELAPVLQGYVQSVTDFSNPPEWAAELEAEYGLQARGRK